MDKCNAPRTSYSPERTLNTMDGFDPMTSEVVGSSMVLAVTEANTSLYISEGGPTDMERGNVYGCVKGSTPEP